MNASWDYYDLAEDQLKAFTRSAVRTKIMLRLKDGGMTAGDLGEDLNMRTSTILHTIKEMIEDDIVMKEGTRYSLTNVGRTQTILLDELVAAIVLLKQHKEYWLNHDMRGIPDHLLAKIGMITHSKMITSDPTAPLSALNNFVKEIYKSNYICGVSSFIAPGFAEMINDSAKRGARIELILTQELYEIILKYQAELLASLQGFRNLSIYTIESNINIGFTVTESILALALCRNDGKIDLGSEIICTGNYAVWWGNELFKYYKGRSEKKAI
jgi:predicted transcriptional regulator